MNNLINNIEKNEMCTGCGICASYNNKVEMKCINGRYIPYFNSNLTLNEIEKFQKICPLSNQYIEQQEGKKFLPVLGNYIEYFHGYSLDKNIRLKASSGGGITSFLIFLIEENLVDCVVQIKENIDNPYKCDSVVSTCRDDILKCMGSRYMPTMPLKNLCNVLEKYDKVAIVGKPCDIRAISNLVNIEPKYNKKFIIKIAFLCGGLPQISATKQMVSDLGISHNNVNSINYRGNGWPGKFTIITREGQKMDMSYEQSWGEYLSKNVLFCCKVCFDSVGEFADISLGDAWNSDEQGYPVFEESEGVNLIIARTKIAVELLSNLKINNYLFIEPYNPNEFYSIQPSQCVRRETAYYKNLALGLANIKGIYVNNKYLKKLVNPKMSKKKKIKAFLGTIKRYTKLRKKNRNAYEK